MADEQAKRMYTREELEAAVHDAKKAENRMATCESSILHQAEGLELLRTEMTSGFTSIRKSITARNSNGWRRSVVGGSGLMGAGGILYWLVELVRGVQHGHPPG